MIKIRVEVHTPRDLVGGVLGRLLYQELGLRAANMQFRVSVLRFVGRVQSALNAQQIARHAALCVCVRGRCAAWKRPSA